MRAKNKNNVELIVTSVLLMFFCVIYLNAENWINSMTTDKFEIGPYAYPKAVCVIAAVLMAAILIKQVRLAHKGLLVGYDSSEEKPTYAIMVVLVIICLAYVWIMPKVGFILSSIILLPVLLLLVGVRRPKSIILFTIGVFAVAFVFFCLLMKLQLPRGKGIFQTFSLLFY